MPAAPQPKRINKKMSKVIGIVGSRKRDDSISFESVKNAFLKVYQKGDTICSGLCSKGADRFAVILSEQYNTKTIWYPALWTKNGISAGYKRNTDIAKMSDILIACVSPDRTGGTEDTIKKYYRYKYGSDNLIIV